MFLTMSDYLMPSANRKPKVCFPILNIFLWNKQLKNTTHTQFKEKKIRIKTKVKIVKKKYLQLMNMFHCLAFIYIYKKNH